MASLYHWLWASWAWDNSTWASWAVSHSLLHKASKYEAGAFPIVVGVSHSTRSMSKISWGWCLYSNSKGGKLVDACSTSQMTNWRKGSH